jgi:sortase A
MLVPPMTDGRRLFLSILNGLLLLGGVLTVAWKTTEPRVVVVDTPLLAASGSSAIAEAPTTTAAPQVAAAPEVTVKPRAPVAVPRNSYAPEPIQQIGTIEIPKIGLIHPIFHGITMRNIDQGPSHWPGSAFPGEVGNAVFAGHRVTHTHPFRNIDQLVEGDEVFFTVNGNRTRYVVTGHEVVVPTTLRIVQPSPTPTATLFACHPPGSASNRYVVHLALAADQPTANP